MEGTDKKLREIAYRLAKPGANMQDVAVYANIHATQIPSLISREIRNGNLLGLSDEQLKILAQNIDDLPLTKSIEAKLGTESSHDNSSSKAKQLADSLEDLSKKLHDRLIKGKPRSKLVNSKKTKIPGFSTYFRKE